MANKVVEGTKVDVEIWTAGQRIMGRVFVPKDQRLSDCLNDDGRRCLSVTNVEVKPLEANNTLMAGDLFGGEQKLRQHGGDNDQQEPSFAVA
jgi:hypothetical protein